MTEQQNLHPRMYLLLPPLFLAVLLFRRAVLRWCLVVQCLWQLWHPGNNFDIVLSILHVSVVWYIFKRYKLLKVFVKVWIINKWLLIKYNTFISKMFTLSVKYIYHCMKDGYILSFKIRNSKIIFFSW